MDDPGPFFARMAREAGAEMPDYEACVAQDRVAPLILEDFGSAVSAGITGTPTFIIMKGDEVVERLVGVRSVEEWARILDSALAEPPGRGWRCLDCRVSSVGGPCRAAAGSREGEEEGQGGQGRGDQAPLAPGVDHQPGDGAEVHGGQERAAVMARSAMGPTAGRPWRLVPTMATANMVTYPSTPQPATGTPRR
jgi:hypothetical protein